ncbi:hypothetical protein ACVW00_003639 [Marmoricola sp. URHA0025 HA25]
MSRTLVRTLLGGGEGTLAVPLALAAAARIQERDWEDFLEDPTQLANGIRDLVDAVAPDGVPVSDDLVLLEQASSAGLSGGPHALAAVVATERLRQSLGDRVALVSVLPGPARLAAAGAVAAAEAILELGKKFLAAGADVVLVRDEAGEAASLSTLLNIARFHQALAVTDVRDDLGLPLVTRVAVEDPTSASGVVITAEVISRDIDFTQLEDWVDAVH